MPKVGMEPVRREAMIRATIQAIGEAGSLDVTVSQIAKRAGMSSALAHHYFGSKDQIFLAAMRHILKGFASSVALRLRNLDTPEARIRAIIAASFSEGQFDKEVVAAWLTFYIRAMQSEDVARLLLVYARRLKSNLQYDLKKLFPDHEAEQVAQGLASMIDGFYIRHALQEVAPDRDATQALVCDYLDLWLERKTHRG
ncbi:transcriptional regulator BetI [Pseudooceanicola sp. 216_PA32_1]|uniref:HTH-type transcriptional regulator BetI n=1 Tax=Pseudooceanicola pacificus TaxID=2676438 RepID=A0A844WDL2_9RHOB|nr:transcriptional regulator BetI [Pseudooceanicola pacificus]MWB79278.1 transcriptional regulator BetI [Pseudooceanicola pacificus]